MQRNCRCPAEQRHRIAHPVHVRDNAQTERNKGETGYDQITRK